MRGGAIGFRLGRWKEIVLAGYSVSERVCWRGKSCSKEMWSHNGKKGGGEDRDGDSGKREDMVHRKGRTTLSGNHSPFLQRPI